MKRITNRRAYRDYDILKTIEAGIKLTGSEAKSVRSGRAKLSGAYVKIIDGQPKLINLHIPHYQNQPDLPAEDRTRQLLLSKKQIAEWSKQNETKGIAIVPLALYTRHNLVKIELGLGKGRREYEKRARVQKRQFERGIARQLKHRTVGRKPGE